MCIRSYFVLDMPVNLFKVFDADHNHLEVLSYIFSSLPFSTLVSLNGVSRSLRKIVQYHIRRRTEYFVKLFIPKDYVVEFFDKLNSTRASLAGSLVRCIVTNEMYGHFKNVNPLRLHIIVPYSSPNAAAEDQQMSKWVRLLATCGYKAFATYNEISEVVRASCQQVMYLKPVSINRPFMFLCLIALCENRLQGVKGPSPLLKPRDAPYFPPFSSLLRRPVSMSCLQRGFISSIRVFMIITSTSLSGTLDTKVPLNHSHTVC